MEWRGIKDYEGYYQVSDTGLVRSLDRNIIYSDGRKYIKKGKILRLKKDRNGYPRVELYRNNKCRGFYVHRLVAEAFIPNPTNLPQVNHKDENILNNNVNNLEWCDGKYNVRYSIAVKVSQFDKSGNYIKTWNCIQDVTQELGISSSHIVMCCKKRMKSAGGFCWNYASDDSFSNDVHLSEEQRRKRDEYNHHRYYQDHNATLTYKREWYKKNAEKMREYGRAWYQKHRDKILAKKRKGNQTARDN